MSGRMMILYKKAEYTKEGIGFRGDDNSLLDI